MTVNRFLTILPSCSEVFRRLSPVPSSNALTMYIVCGSAPLHLLSAGGFVSSQEAVTDESGAGASEREAYYFRPNRIELCLSLPGRSEENEDFVPGSLCARFPDFTNDEHPDVLFFPGALRLAAVVACRYPQRSSHESCFCISAPG